MCGLWKQCKNHLVNRNQKPSRSSPRAIFKTGWGQAEGPVRGLRPQSAELRARGQSEEEALVHGLFEGARRGGEPADPQGLRGLRPQSAGLRAAGREQAAMVWPLRERPARSGEPEPEVRDLLPEAAVFRAAGREQAAMVWPLRERPDRSGEPKISQEEVRGPWRAAAEEGEVKKVPLKKVPLYLFF